MKIKAVRYHDISTGHRVYGHESKCAHMHGHNYRITFHCEAEDLDHVGRVMDFSVIKSKLCYWLEDNWDHKFLVWSRDPWADALQGMDPKGLVRVSFNPTAENMAAFLLNIVSPVQLEGTGVIVTRVDVEETRKCSATCELEGDDNE